MPNQYSCSNDEVASFIPRLTGSHPGEFSIFQEGAHMALGIKPIDSGVRIGHVHLKVANLDRSLGFYQGVLGFELVQQLGDQAAFLAAGGYHHHIALNTWESLGGRPPEPGSTGLYHLAILYPSRA